MAYNYRFHTRTMFKINLEFGRNAYSDEETVPVTWSDEKLILLYCPGRGSNSRPSARSSFKHDQGGPRPNHSATAAVCPVSAYEHWNDLN